MTGSRGAFKKYPQFNHRFMELIAIPKPNARSRRFSMQNFRFSLEVFASIATSMFDVFCVSSGAFTVPFSVPIRYMMWWMFSNEPAYDMPRHNPLFCISTSLR